MFSCLQVPFDGTRSVCHACWHRIDSDTNQAALHAPAAPAVGVVNVEGITRAANTARRCMFDDCHDTHLRQIPNSIKVHLLSYYHFYIPNLARICQRHLLHTPLEDIPQNVTNRLTGLNANYVADIINMYTLALEQRSYLDFENLNEISEEDIRFWTGQTRETFNRLLDEVPTLHRSSNTPRQDLAVYLCKLRTGEPNNRIASIFNLSRRTVDRKILRVRHCLLTDFVPSHLGLDHISREQVIQHNRVLPNYLFGNEESPKAIMICDGTYIFIEKSSNFLFQRRTYSLHKYRNLVKPFLIVCADGYILDVTGPYPARTTDAEIMTQILENHDEPIEDGAFHYFFVEGDVFILDKGFRDSIPLMETYGYDVYMPPTKLRHENQLRREQANKSRKITMVRWVVEAINGRFKRDFKLFRNRVFNKNVPHIFDDFRIAAALINCFQEPYLDSPYLSDFINIIDENIERPNLLAEYVERFNINRQRATFQRMAADNPQVADFPRLTIEDLILFAIGTYHVKVARSYCSEHLKATEVYEMELYRHPEAIINNHVLIRCRINSRHVTTKTYYTYVLYNPEIEGRNAISEYYCSCYHGKRTLGSCAHVVSVIYYLGWARHQDDFYHPALGMATVLLDLEN